MTNIEKGKLAGATANKISQLKYFLDLVRKVHSDSVLIRIGSTTTEARFEAGPKELEFLTLFLNCLIDHNEHELESIFQ